MFQFKMAMTSIRCWGNNRTDENEITYS